MVDLALAILHHLLVFALVALLMAETALLRPAATAADLDRIARLDAGYGATAGLVLIVGLLRVFEGPRGWAFYEANPFFWGKMACFAAMALLSIPPTLRFIAWRRARRTDPGFRPAEAELAATRTLLRAQSLVLVVLLACAAAMARWPL